MQETRRAVRTPHMHRIEQQIFLAIEIVYLVLCTLLPQASCSISPMHERGALPLAWHSTLLFLFYRL